MLVQRCLLICFANKNIILPRLSFVFKSLENNCKTILVDLESKTQQWQRKTTSVDTDNKLGGARNDTDGNKLIKY